MVLVKRLAHIIDQSREHQPHGRAQVTSARGEETGPGSNGINISVSA